MNIIRTLSLSQEQAKEIRSLTALCRQNDGIILSCPEDGDEFWLLYQQSGKKEGCLAAFFAVYKMEPDSWECYAFTRPDCRGRGYFSALLGQVCRHSQEEGEPDLCFIADNHCRAALDVLKHLDAKLLLHEYMMALDLGGSRTRRTALPEQMTVTLWNGDTDLAGIGITDSVRNTATDSAPVPAIAGSCRITLRDTHAYLYSLEVSPALRGQGLGARFLECIISMLKEHGCGRVSLQVSGANEPALGLYRKTGFRITETLSYYLY